MSWIDEQIAIGISDITPRNWPDSFDFIKCLFALKAAHEALGSCSFDGIRHYQDNFDHRLVLIALAAIEELANK